jgi:hypothetical protein
VKKYLFEISDKLAADFVYRGLGRFITLGIKKRFISAVKLTTVMNIDWSMLAIEL